jgi:hypothetical protein
MVWANNEELEEMSGEMSLLEGHVAECKTVAYFSSGAI